MIGSRARSADDLLPGVEIPITLTVYGKGTLERYESDFPGH
jgi:hypothetical protein